MDSRMYQDERQRPLPPDTLRAIASAVDNDGISKALSTLLGEQRLFDIVSTFLGRLPDENRRDIAHRLVDRHAGSWAAGELASIMQTEVNKAVAAEMKRREPEIQAAAEAAMQGVRDAAEELRAKAIRAATEEAERRARQLLARG